MASDTSVEPRKATEVLLSLENKVDTLLKMMVNYDMNIKLTLSRVNEIYRFLSQIPADTTTPPTVNGNEIITTSTEHLLTQSEVPIDNSRTSRLEKPMRLSEDDNQFISSDKKVPVIQKISDSNGKDLFMADVIIMTLDKTVVSKTKTNALGKWQAHLKPNKYLVNITKTDTATKKKIESMQEITVSNSDTTIILPMAIIRR